MNMDRETLAGLYIHIPFCIKKCFYCDFYSTTDLAKQDLFLASLLSEIELTAPSLFKFDTLYVGGGTPSVLPAEAIGQIIAAAFRHFDFKSDAEITLEVNPGTVTAGDFKKYRSFGVNRLNIGVQSFHEDNLKFLDRIHSPSEALATLEWAWQAGFDNIGMDLIYGLPQQDEKNWREDLNQALQTYPAHLSCYLLTCESGTPLENEVRSGQLQLPTEKILKKLYEITVWYLTNHNFLHYEISNFAYQPKDGRNCRKSRHNLKYWTFAPYIGLGPSAHSYLDPERHWNHRSVVKYSRDIREGKLPIADKETLSREQRFMESVYLGFRMTEGIDLANFEHRFGFDFLAIFAEKIREFEKSGWIKVSPTHCALTRSGMIMHDSITAAFTSQDLPENR